MLAYPIPNPAHPPVTELTGENFKSTPLSSVQFPIRLKATLGKNLRLFILVFLQCLAHRQPLKYLLRKWMVTIRWVARKKMLEDSKWSKLQDREPKSLGLRVSIQECPHHHHFLTHWTSVYGTATICQQRTDRELTKHTKVLCSRGFSTVDRHKQH